MIERIPTRKLLVFLIALALVLYAFGALSGQQTSKLSSQAQSSESGFASLSPRGISGGEIIPASCESGVWDSTWDWAHPDGDNSGICAPPQTCTDPTAYNDGEVGACVYLSAPNLYFEPSHVPPNTGAAVMWSWSYPGQPGGTRHCDITTQGSEWNGYANGQEPSGTYNPGGMNTSGAATAVCRMLNVRGAWITSPQANATLIIDTPPVPTTCEDPAANNIGQPLPCTYTPAPTCQDSGANNFGGTLPCTYQPRKVVWTEYCTGGNDPFGHSWQIWRGGGGGSPDLP